jgi:hypothetical protein
MTLMQFLQQRIFTPLKMTTVRDFDRGPLGPNDAEPLLAQWTRTIPRGTEGSGGMVVRRRPTGDDRPRPGVVEHLDHQSSRLLKPASYKFLQTDVLLNAGNATGYGLGMQIRSGRRQAAAVAWRRRLRLHDIESGLPGRQGRRSPRSRTSIPGAPTRLARLPIASPASSLPPPAANATALAQAQRIYADLLKGTTRPSLSSPHQRTPSSPPACSPTTRKSSAARRADGIHCTPVTGLRGGMVIRSFPHSRRRRHARRVTMMTLPDGKIDQFIVSRAG